MININIYTDIMKELTPHVVISVLGNSDLQRAQKVIESVKSRLQEMGIIPLFVPKNFSHQETMEWVQDITSQDDFFINFSFDDEQKIYFRDSEELEMAEIFSKELSIRLDTLYENPTPLFSKGTDTSTFLSSLPLHTWDIHINGFGRSDAEIEMNIMASITDLYCISHTLLPEDKKWPFRDVPSTHFACSAITSAKNKKILPGYKGDILRPNGGVTRGELIHILHQLKNF